MFKFIGVYNSNLMEQKSKPPIVIREQERTRGDVTKVYGKGDNRPFHPGSKEPLINEPIEGVLDYIGVYRYEGKLMEFDTRDPAHGKVVLAAIRSIEEKMQAIPDYLTFLSNEEYFSLKLKEIPEYETAMKIGAGPKIFVGSEENRCGKIALTEITGGTEAGYY